MLGVFCEGDIKVLVVIDIVVCGIDISGFFYVINYDLFNVFEIYVYCIGCIGWVEVSGLVILFCDIEECFYLWDIEKFI